MQPEGDAMGPARRWPWRIAAANTVFVGGIAVYEIVRLARQPRNTERMVALGVWILALSCAAAAWSPRIARAVGAFLRKNH